MSANISTNYAGRDLDLLIFQGFNPEGNSQVTMSLDGGLACAGVQKVAQEFTILFLSDKGSDPWDEDRGTDFMPLLRAGIILDETVLQAQFQFAVLDIFDYLEGRVYDDTPADEILAAADLIAWDLRPGFLKIQVRLTTAAGDSRDYIVPVPVAAG